jgi:class 3 adenylate cyclase
VLATVMFVDLVGSTAKAAELGDQRWRDLLDRDCVVVRRGLERFRGREIKAIGDGFLCVFDGPARAIRAAQSIASGSRSWASRSAPASTPGSAKLIGDDVGGIAVHIGARVVSIADPGAVLVSSTVKDLVAGSGIEFADGGAHTLKGVPGEWRLSSAGA